MANSMKSSSARGGGSGEGKNPFDEEEAHSDIEEVENPSDRVDR